MTQLRQGLDWFSKSLLDVLPAAVYVCDMDAVVVAFNHRAVELWGRTPVAGETEEKYCGSQRMFRADGTYMPHHKTPMEWVLRRGEPAKDIEAVIEQPDGTRVSILVNISPLFDDAGRQIGAVNCFQDLTQQKKVEQDQAELREALRQSQKLEAMGQLVGGVGHDFNNLLTPLMSTLDILHRRGGRDARETRMIDEALQSAERARLLVLRLLAFAHRQPLEARPVDVADLVTGLSSLISSTTGSGIKLVIDTVEDLPPATADANQLEMSLLNLCTNARDAMPDGGTLTITVRSETIGAYHRTDLEAGQYIHLTVTDTGTGMDDKTKARALEAFFSTKTVGKGTGLGLSMAAALAAQLHGELALSSALGIGTTVELWLPVSVDFFDVPELISVLSPDVLAIGRVLLADDDDLVRTSIATMLIDIGYDVVEASSGEEALSLLDRDLHVDILITDQMMPGMTGVDLIAAFNVKRPGVPALLVTGRLDTVAKSANFPRLAKPFRQAELMVKLESLTLVTVE